MNEQLISHGIMQLINEATLAEENCDVGNAIMEVVTTDGIKMEITVKVSVKILAKGEG